MVSEGYRSIQKEDIKTKKIIAVIVLALMPLVTSCSAAKAATTLEIQDQGVEVWVDVTRYSQGSDTYTYTTKNTRSDIYVCVWLTMTQYNNVGWSFNTVKIAPGQSARLGQAWQGNWRKAYSFNYRMAWSGQGNADCI